MIRKQELDSVYRHQKKCEDCPAVSDWRYGRWAKYAAVGEKLCFGYALFEGKSGDPTPCESMEDADCPRPSEPEMAWKPR